VGEDTTMKRQMQGYELLDINVEPKRALIELRKGRFWDGEPATKKGRHHPYAGWILLH
jgi:hypothetical protein